MRLLVDSHALIWAVDDPSHLSSAATVALQDPANTLLVSVATIWEIAIKISLGKLTLSLAYRDWMNRVIGDLSLGILPITVDYADVQVKLSWHHRDPFDRLLVAQSMAEGIRIVSSDTQLDAYGVARIW
jgi:PIN domain nuclease of toxin-antitoxin system